MSYNEVNCVHFLDLLFSQGKSYSTINTARSSLSCFLTNSNGLTIGNSAIVKRFMKGVFELKPPIPRYNFIWDVSVVLSFLGNYFPNEDLSLKVLSYKCAMLLALSSMQRVQTLHVINVENIEFTNDFVFIPIYKLLKQSRAKNYKFVVTLKPYYENRATCPVHTLREYVDRTKPLRKCSQLFISFSRPHLPVSKSTLSRWIKTVMEEAGIDASIFKTHSTRAASSSSARDNNVNIDDIMKTAGWSNASTFKKYYDKAVL